MKLPVLRRGSVANVIAILALVVAVSSTSAYAATIITSKQIKNGTIQNIDVRTGTLTGAKVKDRSITKADLATGTVPAAYPGIKAYAADLLNPVTLDADGENVVSIYIPQPGAYIASAVTAAYNSGGAESTVTCELQGEGGAKDTKQFFVEKLALDSPNRFVASLQLADTFEAAGTFTLRCMSSGSTNVTANTSRISAVKIDALNIQD